MFSGVSVLLNNALLASALFLGGIMISPTASPASVTRVDSFSMKDGFDSMFLAFLRSSVFKTLLPNTFLDM